MNDRPRLRWPVCRPECRTLDLPDRDVCSADNKCAFCHCLYLASQLSSGPGALCSVELCIHIACLWGGETKCEEYGGKVMEVKFPRLGLLTLPGCWRAISHLKRGGQLDINFVSSAAQCPSSIALF